MSDTNDLAHLQLLDTQRVLTLYSHRASIIPLAIHFPNLVSIAELDRLHDQLKGLPFHSDSLKHIDNLERQAFWLGLQQVTDGLNDRKFGLIAPIMSMFLRVSSVYVRQTRIFHR